MGFFSYFKRKNKTGRRSFVGAQKNRLTADWLGLGTNINQDIDAQGIELIQRSRDLLKNNAYIQRWIDLKKNYVIGSGIHLKMNVVEYKNGQPIQDTVANDIIEKMWLKWSKDVLISEDNVTLTEVLKSIVTDVAIDGLELVKKVTTKKSFKLQLIPATHLAWTMRDCKNGIEVINGFEIDSKTKKILAVYVGTTKSTGVLNYSNFQQNDVVRVDAGDLYIVQNKLFSDQVVGFPETTAVIKNLKNLDDYMGAVEIAAKLAAQRPMAFEWTGAVDDDEDVIFPEYEYSEDGQVIVNPKGWKAVPLASSQPNTSHENYIKTALKKASCGLNYSYPLIANDLEGVNYSSLRVGNKTDQASNTAQQMKIINRFLNPLFSDVLEWFLLQEDSILPFDKFDKFNQPTWKGEKLFDTDPLKDANARKLLIEEKLMSPIQAAAEIGRNYEDVQKEIKLSKEIENKYGVSEDENTQK